ncbi:hypothetical protein PHYSODRAFT_314462 [Phytophthora sojae]|uniref:Uncharacterized protein n=1 Tax=Phytophthora sojae (strain P6497) TaxID=1094619 RepID=G4ZIF0_PHYSP|nr:hypothetical protein PHYSODRAFT_314462 [Phytophthora sojae]EGZ16814.1 hypothetical protein PHYSODRAFT_314462 [Phytophthora sojae]|eukprot:XP_009525872.1 hypothetical protein PHYSODRAFT_314462 [Phytophthora sojae]
MLNVNEDMIAAAAECQAEQDIEGLVAYQRILHRDLMEMADFIDSMFGKAQRGALRTAIEAGEKVREIQRSKEQWIKSRHQVLEEEGASAIKSDKSSGMLEVPAEKSGENATQQGCGGVALANQIRAHQHIAAFVKASTKGTTAIPPPPPPPPAPMSLLLTSQLAIPSTAAPLIMPAPLPPPPPPILTTAAQPIKPNTTGSSVAKIALPPANSALNLNMFFPFPGATPLVFNPQVAGGLMPMAPWPQMPASVPARAARPARPQAKTPKFKRMCEACRKRHISVRQCRLVLQHTDPEWQQPAQPPPASQRRRQKEPETNTNVT